MEDKKAGETSQRHEVISHVSVGVRSISEKKGIEDSRLVNCKNKSAQG